MKKAMLFRLLDIFEQVTKFIVKWFWNAVGAYFLRERGFGTHFWGGKLSWNAVLERSTFFVENLFGNTVLGRTVFL